MTTYVPMSFVPTDAWLFSVHDKLLLYSYTGCEYGPTSGGQKTCFIHQKNFHVPYYTSCCYSLHPRHEEKREFGYPLVLWLPHDDADDWSFSTKKRTFQGNLGVSPGLPAICFGYLHETDVF